MKQTSMKRINDLSTVKLLKRLWYLSQKDSESPYIKYIQKHLDKRRTQDPQAHNRDIKKFLSNRKGK